VALAADQQAMLQLLLERGQSYADLGSVLGVDQAEVRARARAALTELGGVDPDRNVGLTDYLLGQADPIDRADAVRHLKDDPSDLALATELSQKLRLVAPQAELPRLPGEERRPRPRRAGAGAVGRLPIPARLRGGRSAGDRADGEGTAPSAPDPAAKGRQTRVMVALGCLAVLLVVGVLAATGAFKGSDASNAATTTTTTTGATTRGQAEGFPLAPLKVSGSGSVSAQVPIPATLRTLIPRVQAVYITMSNSRALAVAVSQAVQSKQLVLPVSGSPQFVGVVGGGNQTTIPIDLKAVKGVRGTGSATLDLTSANNPTLAVKLTKVKPPPKNQVYIAWFVFGLSQ
jgi:hypothetical protein